MKPSNWWKGEGFHGPLWSVSARPSINPDSGLFIAPVDAAVADALEKIPRDCSRHARPNHRCNRPPPCPPARNLRPTSPTRPNPNRRVGLWRVLLGKAKAAKKMRTTRCDPRRPRSIESRSSASRFNLIGGSSVLPGAAPYKLSREAPLASSLRIATRCYPRRTRECTAKLLASACVQRGFGLTRIAANSAAKLLLDPTQWRLARCYPRRPFASNRGASFTIQFV